MRTSVHANQPVGEPNWAWPDSEGIVNRLLFAGLLTCIPIAIVTVFWPALAEAQRGPRYPVPVGARHPDFRLPRVDNGQPLSLQDLRGRKVLLVHFASW
jgi:hypothetical protein